MLGDIEHAPPVDFHPASPQSVVSGLVEISGAAHLHAISGVERTAHEYATLVEVPHLFGHPAVVMETIAPELQEAVRIMRFAASTHVSDAPFVSQLVTQSRI
ncbi:hypothetical protein ACVDG5_033315 [Mesorhizobium sp. ORM6]